MPVIEFGHRIFFRFRDAGGKHVACDFQNCGRRIQHDCWIVLGKRGAQLRHDLVGGRLGPGRLGQPHLVGAVVAERLDARLADSKLRDPSPEIVDPDRLLEFYTDQLAADEIDAEVEAAIGGEGDGGDGGDQRQDQREIAPAHEVEVRVIGNELEELHE